MKKEELKKENSNEELLDEDTQKMKKKFKSLSSWAALLEGILLVPIGIAIVLLIGTGIDCMLNKNKNFTDQVFSMATSHVEGTKITTEDVIELAETLSGGKMTKSDYEEEINLGGDHKETVIKVYAIVKTALAIMDYLILIFIMDNLNKIFVNVNDKGTPFTVDNMKYLKRINISAFILWIWGVGQFSIGIVSLIIISAITYIFKHGYKLQQQVDETI